MPFDGFVDQRYGVHFPRNFVIFRTYLGTPYRAVAGNGAWTRLDTREQFFSLNQLSSSIGAKTENAWMNWFYTDETSQKHMISELRDSSKIQTRG